MLSFEDLKLRSSHIKFPSDGKFYENKCADAKLYHLVSADFSVITDPNLLQNGEMIDVLISKKLAKADHSKHFVNPRHLLVGDRNALLIFLRIQMDSKFIVPLKDPITRKEFKYELDLTTLKTKDVNVLPDDDGLFSFTMERSYMKDGEYIPVEVKFKLMNCEDEAVVREQQRMNPHMKNENMHLRLVQTIQSIGGNEDKKFIDAFLRQADMSEAIKLDDFMDEVMPGIDLSVEAQSPGGGTVKFKLPFSAPLLLPSIER